MKHDLTIASITSRDLVLYDPENLPPEFPVYSDPTRREPEPAPAAMIEQLAREEGAVVIHIPDSDCEATIRLLVGETVPAEVRQKARRKTVRSRLSVPSGVLLASGSEFIHRATLQSSEIDEERIEIPPGSYDVELFSLVAWKGANYEREVLDKAPRSARIASKVLTVYVTFTIAMLVVGFLLLPVVAFLAWRVAGATLAKKVTLWGLLFEAALFASFSVLPRFSLVGELSDRFERDNPDVVIAMSPSTTNEATDPARLVLRS